MILPCQGSKSFAMNTALILEDDFQLATHWRELLEADGIRVIHECTAEAAITVLREETVDILITDMVIEDAERNTSLYGGLMVISYIAMNMDPPPKILAVTGVDTKESFLSSFELFHPDTAMRKPIADKVMSEKVKALLAVRKQEEREREQVKLVHRKMRRSLFSTDRSTEAVYWINQQGKFVYANDAACQMFDRPSDELIGRHLFDVDPDLTADRWQDDWRSMYANQLQTSESRTVCPNGNEGYYFVNRHFYEFEDDQFIVATATDITKMKQDAAQIQADAELLRATNLDLTRSNTELERFAYVASHDLKSPLRGIAIYVRFLCEDFGEQFNEEARRYFNGLTDSVKRMEHIIDDLLLYSRVLRNHSDWQSVDLNDCIEFAKGNLLIEIEEAKAVIHTEQLPIVSGFTPLLRQLFQNLIGNAIKYRSDAVPEIAVEGESNSDGTVIRIRDNGIGIEPQYREQVFEIFQRLHQKDEYSGTGIGLAICQRVMERHDGSISIESNENELGSCFVLNFPFVKNVDQER